MSQVPLDYWKTFIAFIESENITEAAKKLNLSQPSVSIHLRKIEESLPASPFSQTGKKKMLNPYGKKIYLSIKGKLNEFENAVNRANLEYFGLENLHIKIGARREVLLRMVQKINPKYHVSFFEMTGEKALRLLGKMDLDMVITQNETNMSDIYNKKLFTDRAHLIVHKKLLNGKSINDMAKDENFLINTPSIVYNDKLPFMEQWCAHNKVNTNQLNIISQFEDWYGVAQMVERGMGYSIVPSGFESTGKGVVKYDISDRVIKSMDFFALYHKDLNKLDIINKVFEL
ncbi:LysR family transcriptional regulator [bacterium]|nr:LysR family transcriptional regulator [bacterium]